MRATIEFMLHLFKTLLWVVCIVVLLFHLNFLNAKSTQLEEMLKHHPKNFAWKHFKEKFKRSNTLYYTPSSRWKYLGTSIGILGVSFVVGIVGLYLMPESVTNWDKERFGIRSWFEDVRVGPRLDRDSFIFNEVLHPYFGAIYYMQPRMAGFSWMTSVFFSFISSTLFWEYGVEAFVEVPSWQDLIITPLVGSILGEGFYQLTRYIQKNGGKLFNSLFLGRLMIALMDPIGFIIRDLGLGEALGIYNKNEWHSSLSPGGLNLTYKF
ncbi:DUF3943 domain-containing protein [Helicobacter cetorum]|uniref:DUF3943 domain-containing protein n=1 Tax=Helicobacter cetorum (strain ATCC BAA-540 / CCUG 52418 / MIT 99-5656) TaxID=1163745 RepID=I0ET67_HELCM|nr:DUF3943 domain-containing protein [Helicobacter cetorum]AFI06136.1 hypothetical protein HCD_05670 [Helicobacter cetorum MIT 99-5656]